jgi:hypothetical protein
VAYRLAILERAREMYVEDEAVRDRSSKMTPYLAVNTKISHDSKKLYFLLSVFIDF